MALFPEKEEMQNVLFAALVAAATLVATHSHAEEPQPKKTETKQVKYPATTLEYELIGFEYAAGPVKESVLLVPGSDIPFHDVFVGQDVTYPKRATRRDGPQVVPLRVLIGGVEVNPGASGVWLTPSPKSNFIRIHWVKELIVAKTKEGESYPGLPSFGRSDGQVMVYADDRREASQFIVPQDDDGRFAVKWPSAIFTSLETRAAAIKTPEFRTFIESRDKLTDDEKPSGVRKK